MTVHTTSDGDMAGGAVPPTPILKCHMLNVQQGDCFLVEALQDGKVCQRILVDGGPGTGAPGNPNVCDILKTIMPRKEDRIDLIIASHYCEDHLKGLTEIVETGHWTIGHAWLPPIRNDLVDDGTHFLAEYLDGRPENLTAHLAGACGIATGLAEAALKWLKRQETLNASDSVERRCEWRPDGAADTREDLATGDIAALCTLTEEILRHDKAIEDRESITTLVSTLAGFRDAIGKTEAYYETILACLLTELPKQGDMHALEWFLCLWSHRMLFSRFGSVPWSDIGPLMFSCFEEFADDVCPMTRFKVLPKDDVLMALVTGAVKASASKAITAVHLNELLNALHRKGISHSIPVCPNDGMTEYVQYLDAWVPSRRPVNGHPLIIRHFSPVWRQISKYRSLIPVASSACMSYLTVQNRLSHVVAIGVDDAHQLLFTGDTGFEGIDPSRKNVTEIEKLLRRCDVLKVSHHGGEAGKFNRVFIGAVQAGRTAPIHLLLPVGKSKQTHPGKDFAELHAALKKLRLSATALWSNYSSSPDSHTPNGPGKAGPDVVTLALGDSGGWKLETPTALTS